MSTRRAYIDASNVAVIVQLAIDLHHGLRADFYKLPPEHQDRLMRRAHTILRKLRKITLDHEREVSRDPG